MSLKKIAFETYVSEKVDYREMTLEFFLDNVEEAKSLGLTHWGTQTDKEAKPWTVNLLFYTKQKETT